MVSNHWPQTPSPLEVRLKPQIICTPWLCSMHPCQNVFTMSSACHKQALLLIATSASLVALIFFLFFYRRVTVVPLLAFSFLCFFLSSQIILPENTNFCSTVRAEDGRPTTVMRKNILKYVVLHVVGRTTLLGWDSPWGTNHLVVMLNSGQVLKSFLKWGAAYKPAVLLLPLHSLSSVSPCSFMSETVALYSPHSLFDVKMWVIHHWCILHVYGCGMALFIYLFLLVAWEQIFLTLAALREHIRQRFKNVFVFIHRIFSGFCCCWRKFLCLHV